MGNWKFVLRVSIARLMLPSILALSACSAAEDGAEPQGSDPSGTRTASTTSESATPANAALAESGAPTATAHPNRVDKPFVLPYAVRLLSEAEQSTYLEAIDDTEFAALVENARIAAFLRENVDPSTLESLNARLPELGIFTLENVTPHLSPEELARLSSFELDVTKSRQEEPDSSAVEKGCGSFSFKGYSTSCNAFFGYCTTCEIWRRSCDWWDPRYREDRRNCYTVYYL